MAETVVAEKSKSGGKADRHLPWIEKYRPKTFKVSHALLK
jgi:hypothetical protein